VARSDLPGRGVVRALVTASFVTPPFLGAIAWEILACAEQRPRQRRLPRPVRAGALRVPRRHLHLRGPRLRHRLLHLPLRVHPGGERAGAGADGPRGCLRHAGRRARDHAQARHPAARSCPRCWLGR
jgi:hypothetical protein